MNYERKFIEERNYKKSLITTFIKKILYIVLIIAIYNAVLITKSSLDDVGSKEIFGYKAYIIITESMKPTIKVGDVIIVEKCEEEKLRIGDIITIQNKEKTIVTHRIVEIQVDEETGRNEYLTKGDNNNVGDSESIKYAQIQGRKVVIIPLFGKLLLAFRSKTYIIILAIAILTIFWHIASLQRKKRIRREKKKNEEQRQKEDID